MSQKSLLFSKESTSKRLPQIFSQAENWGPAGGLGKQIFPQLLEKTNCKNLIRWVFLSVGEIKNLEFFSNFCCAMAKCVSTTPNFSRDSNKISTSV
ncbi:MAG: hypothetical protein ONA90_08735, partial [candidate division KSB1 bacterium]|nr:hypothetical protein [candidate division KSB1 bacterium]